MLPLRAVRRRLLLLATFPSLVAALPLNIRLETSASWIDNLSRTSAAADRKDGSRVTADLAARTFRNLKSGFLVSGELGTTIEHVPDFPDAGTLDVRGQLGLRRKFGLGAFAPALDVSASASYRDTRHPAAAGWTAAASARLSKRLTRTWRIAAGAELTNHAARHETFDTSHHRLFATATCDLTPRWQLTAGAGRLRGDFTANAAPATWARALAGDFGPAVFTYYNTVARQRTEIYGLGWVTYRIEGHADFAWLELSPALGRNTSLPLRLERTDATNRIGIKYRQDSVTLSLLHRF